MTETRQPEPWLRGTHVETRAVQRAVLHALELAKEDLEKWCGNLSDEQLNARSSGLAPVAFHIRHIARSIDRLLTYAEGRNLSAGQLTALNTELDEGATHDVLFGEFTEAVATSMERICALEAEGMEEARAVGTKRLPTTVGGLLVHIADHTQRHVGQAIVTAKIVLARS